VGDRASRRVAARAVVEAWQVGRGPGAGCLALAG